MKRLRCLIIGASMCMPSFDIAYEDTWPYKIIRKYPDIDFIDKNRRSSSARRLITEGALEKGYDLLEYYKPDFVITHFGITDCAPRLLKREWISTRVLNHLPFSKCIYDIIRRIKGRTISCSDISKETFYDCFSQYATRAKESHTHVFCVKIAHTGASLIKKSPHIIEAIDLYNKEFDRLAANFSNVTVIDPYPKDADLQQLLIKDDQHPNEKGSDIMFHSIINALEQKKKKKMGNDET